jgi:hypothetical protein
MASSGAQALAKYYQGKGDIPTTVKTAGSALDLDGKATGTQLAAGTPVLVLKTTEYDSRPQIRVSIGGRAQTVRFKFDALVKPGNKASAATSLKPQAFDVVTSNPIQLSEYLRRSKAAAEERTDLDGPLKSYLLLLLDYWGGRSAAKAKILPLYQKIQNDIPINDVNKDFGEVLGPLAVLKHNILAGTGHEKDINATSGIFIPARPNEPLMDYKVGPVVISAKSGTTTNTVKPADIIDLLAKKPALLRKYKPTAEFQILTMLNENSILDGPIVAAKYLLGKKYASWKSNNAYLKGKKGKETDNELMYECEKYLQNESKTGGLNFTKLFADAIKGNVVYVKFEVDASGIGKFQSIVSKDLLSLAQGKRPYLRGKNGYTRASDRMGIQI